MVDVFVVVVKHKTSSISCLSSLSISYSLLLTPTFNYKVFIKSSASSSFSKYSFSLGGHGNIKIALLFLSLD